METFSALPSRLSKFGFHKSASELCDVKSTSRDNEKRLSRSSSYHDLRDGQRVFGSGQHSSSTSDLTRQDLFSSRQNSLSDISRNGASWRGSSNDLNGNYQEQSRPSTRLSAIIGLSGSSADLGYISQPGSRRPSFGVSQLIPFEHFQYIHWEFIEQIKINLLMSFD